MLYSKQILRLTVLTTEPVCNPGIYAGALNKPHAMRCAWMYADCKLDITDYTALKQITSMVSQQASTLCPSSKLCSTVTLSLKFCRAMTLLMASARLMWRVMLGRLFSWAAKSLSSAKLRSDPLLPL